MDFSSTPSRRSIDRATDGVSLHESKFWSQGLFYPPSPAFPKSTRSQLKTPNTIIIKHFPSPLSPPGPAVASMVEGSRSQELNQVVAARTKRLPSYKEARHR